MLQGAGEGAFDVDGDGDGIGEESDVEVVTREGFFKRSPRP